MLRCPFHRLACQTECDENGRPVGPLRAASWPFQLAGGLSQRVAEIPTEAPIPRKAPLSRCGLLQANMTHEFNQQGAAYDWKPELFRRMNLPVYDSAIEWLEKQNTERKTLLDACQTEKVNKRRVELKRLRGQERILWSKQHGKDTYGEIGSDKKTRRYTRANRKASAPESRTQMTVSNLIQRLPVTVTVLLSHQFGTPTVTLR